MTYKTYTGHCTTHQLYCMVVLSPEQLIPKLLNDEPLAIIWQIVDLIVNEYIHLNLHPSVPIPVTTEGALTVLQILNDEHLLLSILLQTEWAKSRYILSNQTLLDKIELANDYPLSGSFTNIYRTHIKNLSAKLKHLLSI